MTYPSYDKKPLPVERASMVYWSIHKLIYLASYEELLSIIGKKDNSICNSFPQNSMRVNASTNLKEKQAKLTDEEIAIIRGLPRYGKVSQ
jgi:hypothetical protein